MKYYTLKSYISSSPRSEPFQGRYILEKLSTPKQKAGIKNFNKLLVTDVTTGVYNQTLYPSIIAFAKAIGSNSNNVTRYLSQKDFFWIQKY